jgi:hypothetical protein
VNLLNLNGHPVSGHAVLKTVNLGTTELWAALTVPAASPVYQLAREAVLANKLEVTLTGEVHDPLKEVIFDFRATGQLINGRVGRDIKADFTSSNFVGLPRKADAAAVTSSDSPLSPSTSSNKI